MSQIESLCGPWADECVAGALQSTAAHAPLGSWLGKMPLNVGVLIHMQLPSLI